MSTSVARRRGGARPRSPRRPAQADGPGQQFHATHLERVARSAGEAFAWTGEEAPPPRSAGYGSTAIWVGVGAVAALGLWAAF